MEAANQAAMSAEGPDLSKIKRAPIVIALIIGAFVAILNETLLGNAFPDLIKALNVTASTIQWLSTAYMLVVGVLVPVTAILQEWFTTRQMFIGAMTFFLIGTIIAAFAPGFEVLLVGRVVQALGTGLMLPVMMNTILAIFPPEKRGGAMGLIGLVIMVAPAIGPTVSGLILDSLEWRWLFYLVIPLAVFSIIFASIYMKNVSTITKPKVDILSIILSTIGFGGVVYGFSKSGDLGWSDPEVYWMVTAGVLGILLFAVRQLTLKSPVMDMRAFKFPMFSLVTVLMLVMMMTLFSTLTLLPMYLQGPLMLTAFASGLLMLPGGLVNGLMAPVAGILFDKLGPRVLVIPGLAIVVVAIYLFTGIDMDTTKGYLIMVHIIMMIGISLVMMPAQTTALNQLPRALYPHGTAIMNTLQQVAGAIGVALFISIMSNGSKDYLAKSSNPTDPLESLKGMVEGLHNAFWVGLCMGVLALVIGLFIRRTKPPEGEEPRQGMGH
ncbi:DHA2 family lincomycin resistance protein-like MFS transporter [Paenibacillus cellulosilyticus]|uniref:DHA2 family lincomycin resistance protein-like MFS transporter n=2 Tax=Paenibacillus cellulosilyticus TaxID=375489 RepID=A0A2V2YTW3_9BACL|nr:DHA2 family efflux MFS transporter permease subunit [Paenibacillus cellulosilyticus]PWW02386.1 DHA2 family lincomycin resistance protein-like MFS transporter [Paenibacillus cellulosilyticus]QKS47099.1 multidrug efflux MFS transporter [Paenibacillus cellulosilyticus]